MSNVDQQLSMLHHLMYRKQVQITINYSINRPANKLFIWQPLPVTSCWLA